MGAATQQEIEMMHRDPERIDSFDGSAVDDMGRRGQILWIRGLTRLQQQVSARNYVGVGLHVKRPFVSCCVVSSLCSVLCHLRAILFF